MSEKEEKDIEFKSTIGHHGAYIEETKKIFKEYSEVQSKEELERRIIEDNILNKASESYRKNISREVMRRYFSDENGYKQTTLMKVMNSNLAESKKNWIMYYEFSKDPLVYELTTNLIYEKYMEGASKVYKEDIIDHINNLKDNHPEIDRWSEHTIKQISKQYLSALRNFGILEGARKKEFKFISTPNEVVVYVLYSLIENGIERSKEIIHHNDWKLFMMDKNTVRNKLSRISPEFIRYEKRGSVEKIEPKYDSLEEVIDDF